MTHADKLRSGERRCARWPALRSCGGLRNRCRTQGCR
jgi:hypothetical protein